MADIFTSAGEAFVVDVLDGTKSNPLYAIGFGTGTGTAVKTDTSLSIEITHRVAPTVSQNADDTSRYLGTITASASGLAITEMGLFESVDVAAPMIVRSDFTALNLTASDKVEFTVDIQYN